MNKKANIISILNRFKRIKPDEAFSRTSKILILAHRPLNEPTKDYEALLRHTPNRFAFSIQAPLRSLSFLVAGVTIAVVSFYAIQELSPVLFPGLNAQKITAEAAMVNQQMNIQLSQLHTFDATVQQSNDALHQITQKQMNHLNTTIIQQETTTINGSVASSSPSSTDQVTQQVNSIINQLGQ